MDSETTSVCSSKSDTVSCTSSEDDTNEIIYSDKAKGVYSLYQVGDGSAEDDNGIPTRYLKVANQDRAKARQLVQATLGWRQENGINDMLNTPHTKYDICKAVVPHYYLGRDAQGRVVYVHRPTHLNMAQARANGVELEDLLHHFIYVTEYLWQIIEADNPLGQVTTVVDVGDLYLSDIGKLQEQLSFLLQFCAILDNHFPMRGHKTILVNAPSWFSYLWRLIKPVLLESTREIIEITSKGKQQDATLLECLGEETSQSSLLDFCFSSNNKTRKRVETNVDDLQLEKDMRAFVLSCMQAHGETIKLMSS